jgi:hypothetical protein
MRQLFSEIKAAGYEATFQYEGITVIGTTGTIVFGQDGDGFSAYVQQNLPAGPVFTSPEVLTNAAALELCSRYASTASVAA